MKKTYLFILLSLVFVTTTFAQERKLKISSFNVRNDNSGDASAGNGWVNRYPEIVNIIQFYDLDIIGTQECKSNQIDDLNNNLPNYTYIGVGRGDGVRDDEFSAIFYNTDKFTVISHGDFWLSDTPEVPSLGWDASHKRICTWGEFEVKATGYKFFAFNLHMDHVGTNARVNSSELVLAKMKEIAPDQPIVLTGDFNVDQYSAGYELLTTSCYMTNGGGNILFDSFLLAPIKHTPNGTFNGWDIKNTTAQRIDHVFVTEHFNPTRYGVLTDVYWTDTNGTPIHSGDFPKETQFIQGTVRLVSDHYPVVVELQY